MLTRSSSSALELGLNPAKRVKLAIDDEPDKVLAPAPSGESMRLSEVKRNFLRFIAGGFRVLFACSYAADEIGEGVNDGDDEDAEMKYIRVNLLSVGKSMIGAQRYWFSECKLDELRFAAMISGSTDSSLAAPRVLQRILCSLQAARRQTSEQNLTVLQPPHTRSLSPAVGRCLHLKHDSICASPSLTPIEVPGLIFGADCSPSSLFDAK
jgi:hypothetical protein